jgi:2-deoxy-D-gluconate 3-dehydrogenase
MSDSGPFGLAGKRIAVTGANTGLGQGIAVSLGRAGADVVGVGRSAMEETRAKVGAEGGRFTSVMCELSDPDAVGALIGEIWSAEGPLDGLVNNAGIIRRADALEVSERDWDDVIEINLTVPFRLSRAFAQRVFAEGRGGKIVNIASLLSFQGGIRVAAYTASKHGLAGLTKTLANEWAGRGINVNAIAPGYMVTNNTEALRADDKRSAEILARIPAGRWGEPSDIGETAVYLCAPASDYVHGAVIPVDGGWLAR